MNRAMLLTGRENIISLSLAWSKKNNRSQSYHKLKLGSSSKSGSKSRFGSHKKSGSSSGIESDIKLNLGILCFSGTTSSSETRLSYRVRSRCSYKDINFNLAWNAPDNNESDYDLAYIA